jgi:hypothetical protein
LKRRKKIKMANFLIVSKNQENINFAKQYNIWQTINTFHKVTPGDIAFIKLSGSKNIEYLGVVERVGIEPVLRWPDNNEYEKTKTDIQFTIRLRPIQNIDFKGRSTAIKYAKED